MAFTRQQPFSKKTTDLPDVPSPSYTATQIKEYIETPSDENKSFVDSFLNELEADTGAASVGAKKADGTASDVQTTLDEKQTKTALSNVTGANLVGAKKGDGTTSTVQGALDEKAVKGGDWTGTWQGYTPSKADPGISSVVEQHTSQLADIMTNALYVESYNIIAPEADDTGRIQRAFNDANTNKKAVIFPFKKEFTISTALSNNGDILIIGNLSTIKLTNASDYMIKSVTSPTLIDFILFDLILDGNNLNTGNSLIYLQGTKKVIIEHYGIKNSKSNGIWCFDDNQNVLVTKGLVDNCLFSGILLEGNNGSTTYATQQEINAIVSSNIITNCQQQNGIFACHGLKKVTIVHNIVKNCGDEGIELGGSAGVYGIEDAVVSDNTIDSVGMYNSNQSAGILVYRSTNVSGGNNVCINGYHGLQIKNSNEVKLQAILKDCRGTIINLDSSVDIDIDVESNNSVPTQLLINASKHFCISVKDESTQPATISFDHTYDGTTNLINSNIKWRGKIAPTLSNIKWGLYLDIVTEDGFYYTNVFKSNAIPNSLFIKNSLTGWNSETGLTATASGGEVTLSSTTDFRKFYAYLYQFANKYGNQFILSFDYQTDNTDTIVYVDTTDGTSNLSPAPVSVSLPASSGVFTTKRILFVLSSYYPDCKISFVPRSAGGLGNMVLKNIKLLMPIASEDIGILDKTTMYQ